MNRILFIISLLFSSSVFAEDLLLVEIPEQCHDYLKYSLPKPPENNYTILCNMGYMNIYENHWKIPRYTIHTLEAKLLSLDKYPRSNNFREDKRLPEEYRSKLSDYKGSGYDRGHNVPNGDRNYDQNLMDETFLLSNIVPQGKSANQSAMESVESHVREEVKRRGFAFIYTGGVVDETDSKTIGKSKVFVPKYLFKIACYPNNYEEAFLIENLDSGLKKNYVNYLTSIQKINQLTNLEFSCGAKY